MIRKIEINDWKNMSMKDKLKKIPWVALLVIAVFVLAVLFLVVACYDSTQPFPEQSLNVVFEGEYKVGNGEYAPIVPGQHIHSPQGKVTLRGRFWLCDPETGEIVSGVNRGTNISFHLSHIGVTVHAPGVAPYTFDCEKEQFDEDTCGEMILPYTYRGDEGDMVTIIINNPHFFGNDNAVDHLCESFAVYDGANYENDQISQGNLQRILGLIAIISAFLILGVAVFSSLIHVDEGRKLCFVGFMMMFAGGYFLLSVPAIGLWSKLVVFNTVAQGLCMMFYVIFLLIFATFFLKKKHKWIGHTAIITMTLATAVSVIISFSKNILFYDTYFFWFALNLIMSLAVLVALLANLKHLEFANVGMAVLAALAILAVNADAIATLAGLWRGGVVSRFIFVALYAASFFTILRILPANVNAAIRAKELEKERQELKAKLHESRISIMLSQIQPHFLYNTLNSIYYLCEKDPVAAQSAINHFSDYLRNNLNNLQETELITFGAELEHVNTYLALEKVRFGDELEIIWDTPVTDFFVPVLTVQPLVENAVKHGISQKRGGGRVTLQSREYETHYEIIVSDTGTGFDPQHYGDDGRTHVGIENVTNRLDMRCNGTLHIQSAVGEGTVATIKIPKNI